MNTPEPSRRPLSDAFYHSPLLHTSQFCARVIVVFLGMAGTHLFSWAMGSQLPVMRAIFPLQMIPLLVSLLAATWGMILLNKAFLTECQCGPKLTNMSIERNSDLQRLIDSSVLWVIISNLMFIPLMPLVGDDWELLWAAANLVSVAPFLLFWSSERSNQLESNARLALTPQLSIDQLTDIPAERLNKILELARAAGETENANVITRRLQQK
ncbi:MAG: hypothetical protein KGS72_26415 [Cyanobacteria bacterium REEB67]|nr:hypothetical protein [Cyanobacteria bacterium REEB67]